MLSQNLNSIGLFRICSFKGVILKRQLAASKDRIRPTRLTVSCVTILAMEALDVRCVPSAYLEKARNREAFVPKSEGVWAWVDTVKKVN